MSRVLHILTLVLTLASSAAAQVSGPPFVFVAGTVISPDDMNLNFSTIYDAACNRGGCTMTGSFAGVNGTFSGTLGVTGATTLSSTLGVTGATTLAALSATTGTFSSTLGVTGATTLAALSATTGSFSSTLAVTGAATLTSTLAVNSTSASAIDVAGGITAGSGNVAIVGTDGRIPSISSTTFASLSGANLTGILESAITDSTILARVAGNESITGQWGFTNPVRVADGSQTAPSLSFSSDTNTGIYLAAPDVLTFATGGLAHGGFIENGNFRHNRGLEFPGVINPAALPGNSNDYTPTGLSTARRLNLTCSGSCDITGIAAQADGREILVCSAQALGVGIITLVDQGASTASSAANRFVSGATLDGECSLIVYNGTMSRWQISGGF